MLSRMVSGRVSTEGPSLADRVKVLEEHVRVTEEARKRTEDRARKLQEDHDTLAAWKVDAETALARKDQLLSYVATNNERLSEAFAKGPGRAGSGPGVGGDYPRE